MPWDPDRAARWETDMKSMRDGKEEIQRQNPRGVHRKHILGPANELSKVAGYKINARNSIVFQTTSDKHTNTKMKNTAPFTSAQESKYFGVDLMKQVQDCVSYAA